MNELQIIEIIRQLFETKDYPLTDDVAYLPNGLAFKVDMLVKSTDVPKGMSWYQVGRKALVSVLSDVSTKGVRPEFMMLSLALRKGITEEQIRDMLRGIKDLSVRYKIKLIGGDVNRAKDLAIDCVVFGSYKNMVFRGGARPGDLIYVTGEFGLTAVGLDFLLKGKDIKNSRLKELALKWVYEPEPPIEFNLDVVESGLITSSMDSSDGLAFTLNEMAEQSGLRFLIENYPMSEEIIKMIKEEGRDPLSDAMYGGEEYQMVFTVPPEKEQEVIEKAEEHHVVLHRIGHVVQGKGVYFAGANRNIRKRGWIFTF
jgi:thiamine-monophosphate kinase